MDKMIVTGCPAHNGEYEIDFTFTHRELHLIKRISGVRIGELEEAVGADDTDVILALAIIAIQRQGQAVDEDALWDSGFGAIRYQADETVDVPVDPTPLPSPSVTNGGSGDATSTSSAHPESLLNPTGGPT